MNLGEIVVSVKDLFYEEQMNPLAALFLMWVQYRSSICPSHSLSPILTHYPIPGLVLLTSAFFSHPRVPSIFR